MHHGFALRYIAEVMKWSDDVEERETSWLRLISEFKYDGYHDFLSGSRFVEALLAWLQQFEAVDRPLAYRLLKERIIFISSPEMQHLVLRAYPAHIQRFLEARVARKLDLPRYLIGSTKESLAALRDAMKSTLFIGLSDGARMDHFRRANSGIISNEQVISTPEVAGEKWQGIHNELTKRTGNKASVFEMIVLLDDFTASGTSLIWQKDGVWKGKLVKTCAQLNSHAEAFAPDYGVIVHHYLGTSAIETALREKLREITEVAQFKPLFKSGEPPTVSFGMLIPEGALLPPGRWPDLDRFLEKYYDPKVMTTHLLLGGSDVKHGFAQCGLPLVIEHNAPNNSLGIIWAESPANSDSPRRMRPLFRRRQRHV